MFFGYTILDWAWAQEPFRVAWVIRSDGELLSLTFLKEQEVFAWAQHQTTLGGWESLCTIPEGTEDAVYLISGRTLVPSSPHKFVERMYTRNFQNNIVNSRFLDAALEYIGSPITVVTGLEHLEGQTVTAVGDGIEYAGLVVANRQVTLPLAASNIVVGLPYTAELQNLPIDTPAEKGTAQGRYKKVSTLTARVVQTKGLQMGTTFSTLKASKVTAGPPANSPFGTWTNGLFTGDDRMTIDPAITEFGQTCIRQSHPWPMTVLGMISGLTLEDQPDK